MDLPLYVVSAKDHSRDGDAHRWVVTWADRFSSVEYTRDLYQPRRRTTEVNEEAERMMAQHDAGDERPVSEHPTDLCPLLVGRTRPVPHRRPFVVIRVPAHASQNAGSCSVASGLGRLLTLALGSPQEDQPAPQVQDQQVGRPENRVAFDGVDR